MAKRLNSNIIYSLPVKAVEPGNQFTKHNLPHFVHKVFFQDKNGEIYLGEYITHEPNQLVFLPGVRQPFKVSEVQDKGDVIVPLMDYDQTEEKKVNPSCLRQVNGESYSAAVMIAKDILVSSKPMQDISAEDIAGMLKHADLIDEWIISKQQLRIIGL